MKIRVAMFTLAVAGTFAGLAEKPFLAFNEDDTHYYSNAAHMSREGFRSYIADVCRGPMTHFFLCANAQRAIFDSKTFDPAWKGMNPPRGYAGYLKKLVDDGFDPIQLWLECCREKGVSFWISMRMNDIHDVNDIDNSYHSSFWRAHPEYWRVAAGKRCGRERAFNYAIEEVRNYHLAFLKELVDRYDADGYELDWMRFPEHLPPGREIEYSWALTQVVREARKYADAAAARRGKPVKIGVRVPATPEIAQVYGENVIAWAREKLVDLIVPCNYYSTADFDIPIAYWMQTIREINPDVLVIPGTDSGVMVDNTVRRRLMNTAEICGWAEALRADGAKGLYLFNLYENPRDSEVWNAVLSSGLSAEYLATARRVIPKSFRDTAVPLYNNRQLPASLRGGKLIHLRTGIPPQTGTVAVLTAFNAPAVPDGLLKSVTLNGVPNEGVREANPDVWIAGLKENAAKMANVKRSGVGPDIKSSYRFAFPLKALRRGVNEVGFGSHDTIKLYCCALEIDPKGK